MKLLLVVSAIFAFSACGVNSDKSTYRMLKKWANNKAMEGCLGDSYNIMMKKKKEAKAKCSGIEAPELDLPMFKSPYRAVQALLQGAKDTERMKLIEFLSELGANKASGSHQHQSGSPIIAFMSPFPYMKQPGQAPGMAFKRTMMQAMMKNMLKGMAEGGDMSDMDMAEDEDSGISRELLGGMSGSESASQEAMFNKIFTADMSRKRRAAEEGLAVEEAVKVTDIYDLGERLNEKLMAEQKRVQMEMGNTSCSMMEMGIIDKDMNLDIEGMVKTLENYKLEDAWFKQETTNAMRRCYSVAEKLPLEYLNSCVHGEKWAKINFFEHCCKMADFKNCMSLDTKKKLEMNFGSLEDLEKSTGMDAKYLLPLASTILNEASLF